LVIQAFETPFVSSVNVAWGELDGGARSRAQFYTNVPVSADPARQVAEFARNNGFDVRLLPSPRWGGRTCACSATEYHSPQTAIAEIIELYQAGWSLQRLGDRFGRDAQAIRRILIAQEVTLRPRPGWKYLAAERRVGDPPARSPAFVPPKGSILKSQVKYDL
jgi:hypothetical protein